jgi:hypothetical protein
VPFVYTGDHQTWVVPAGVCAVTVDAFGAEGSAGYTPSWPPPAGGKGAEATATIAVTAGETLQVNVGGQSGFNGGAAGGRGERGGSGGGASDVTRDPTGTPTRLIVAGGGGGGAAGAGGQGGPGGDAGQNGTAGTSWAGDGGGGGTQTAGGTGGAGGTGSTYAGGPGSDGSLGAGGVGGDGGPNGGFFYGGGGGGGGGGYYGGGGGGGADGSPSLIFFGGGGGGGSSYGPAGTTFTSGARSGNGAVTISYDSVTGGCVSIGTTTTLTVNPNPPAFNQPVTLTATVSPLAGSSTPTGTVIFFDGTTALGSASLVSGQASVTTTLDAGPHSVTAQYLPDTNAYSGSASDPVLIASQCTRTITGTQSALSARSGLTCVMSGHFTGGITLTGGAQLDLEHASVAGSISASQPGAIRICGSTTGSIVVRKASGFVRIGDPSDNCAGNTILGGVTATHNTGGGTLIHNKISGSWSVTSNSPAWTVAGNYH